MYRYVRCQMSVMGFIGISEYAFLLTTLYCLHNNMCFNVLFGFICLEYNCLNVHLGNQHDPLIRLEYNSGIYSGIAAISYNSFICYRFICFIILIAQFIVDIELYCFVAWA